MFAPIAYIHNVQYKLFLKCILYRSSCLIIHNFDFFALGFSSSSTFPILMEHTTEKCRSRLAFGFFLFWQLGLVTLPLIGYLVPEWRMFLLTVVVCGVPSLLLVW